MIYLFLLVIFAITFVESIFRFTFLQFILAIVVGLSWAATALAWITSQHDPSYTRLAIVLGVFAASTTIWLYILQRRWQQRRYESRDRSRYR